MENLSGSVAQNLCVENGYFPNGDVFLTTGLSPTNLIFLLLKKRFEVTVNPLSGLQIKETLGFLLPLFSALISKFIIWFEKFVQG